MTKKDIRISARVTEKEKKKIAALAEKCGLQQTEYVRQRALGFEPRPVLPDVFFVFCEKIDALTDQPFSPEINVAALRLISEIEKELILPRLEDMQKWQPQVSGRSEES